MQSNRTIIQKFSFSEIRNRKTTDFLQDSWNQQSSLMEDYNFPTLREQLLSVHKIIVKDMWLEENTEYHFRKSKNLNWWKMISPNEDTQAFWEALQSLKIRAYDDCEKIIWVFSQTKIFNMKEASLLLSNPANEPHDEKLKKV